MKKRIAPLLLALAVMAGLCVALQGTPMVRGVARILGAAPAAHATVPSVSCGANQALGWTGSAFTCITLTDPLSSLSEVSSSTTVAANGTVGSVTASCTGGKLVVSGGCNFGNISASNYEHMMRHSRPNSALTGWECESWNNRSSSATLTAYAVCAPAVQ